VQARKAEVEATIEKAATDQAAAVALAIQTTTVRECAVVDLTVE
jgi:hypothetical protein